MTKRKMKYLSNELSYAEKEVLILLENNKGMKFYNSEIEQATGVHSSYINDVVKNLRLKGYEIRTNHRNGKHEYIENSFASYVLTAFIALIIITIFIFAGLDYLAADPVVYEIEKIIE